MKKHALGTENCFPFECVCSNKAFNAQTSASQRFPLNSLSPPNLHMFAVKPWQYKTNSLHIWLVCEFKSWGKEPAVLSSVSSLSHMCALGMAVNRRAGVGNSAVFWVVVVAFRILTWVIAPWATNHHLSCQRNKVLNRPSQHTGRIRTTSGRPREALRWGTTPSTPSHTELKTRGRPL